MNNDPRADSSGEEISRGGMYEPQDRPALNEDAPDSGTATATKIKERATEAVDQVRERATDTADKAVEGTASGMESAAGTLREKFEGQGGIQEKAGTTVASGMERTAEYLREHDTQQMMTDVEAYIKEHPTQALIAAVGVGFLLGRMMR